MLTIAFGFLAWISTVAASVRSNACTIAALLFVFPFLPRYIGIGIGSQDLALSFRRIVIFTLLIIVFSQMLRAQRFLVRKPLLVFASMFLITVVASTVSGLLNGFSTAILFRFVENTTLIIIGTFVGATAIKRFGFEGLVKYAFVWPLYVIAPLALFEWVSGVSAFYELFGTGEFASGLDARAYHMRGGVIRSQASFDGPLQLSEFLVLSLPMLFYMLGKERRWKWILLIACTYLAILSTGSRTGMAISVLLIYLQIVFAAFGQNSRVRRGAIALAIVGMMTVVVAAIGYKLSSFQFVDSFLVFDTSEERSTYSRLRQYPLIFEALRDHPFIGIGYARNQTDELGIAIDNFYLWTALEGGLISVLAVFSMIFMVIRKGLSLLRGRNSHELIRIGFAMTAFTTAFAIQKAFLQSPTNLLYFFVFSSAILALPLASGRMEAWRREPGSSAPSASDRQT